MNTLWLCRFLMLCFVCVAAGCDQRPEIELFNHSGRDLVVSIVLPSGIEEFSLKRAQSVRFLLVKTFSIASGNQKFMYAVDLSNGVALRNLERGEFFNRRILKHQIEPNGHIIVLPPESTAAVENLPPQPKGYPILPSAPWIGG